MPTPASPISPAKPASKADEQLHIAELRRRIGTLPKDMVVNADEDAALRRFLVARKWDLNNAEGQLRRSLEWRSHVYRIPAFLARLQTRPGDV
jgi:hypothetical protein